MGSRGADRGAVLSYLVLAIFCMPLFAAAIDFHDRRRGRVRRSSLVILAERHDLHADLVATQHQGICIPIDDICRDRQRHR